MAVVGIYAQMDRQEDGEKVEVTCHGIEPEPFTCKVAHPDVPGEFFFAPLASLITGAARLMLGLLPTRPDRRELRPALHCERLLGTASGFHLP